MKPLQIIVAIMLLALSGCEKKEIKKMNETVRALAGEWMIGDFFVADANAPKNVVDLLNPLTPICNRDGRPLPLHHLAFAIRTATKVKLTLGPRHRREVTASRFQIGTSHQQERIIRKIPQFQLFVPLAHRCDSVLNLNPAWRPFTHHALRTHLDSNKNP